MSHFSLVEFGGVGGDVEDGDVILGGS
jgi:hypothetical protein